MSEKQTIHVISHSHWDREWYLPFEVHRVRLVELIQSLMDTMDQEMEFRSFHLDGQTIILDDYLEIHPEQRDRIIRLVKEGRLHIGPWYILQDEFLTSSEANLRNLQIGMKMAESYGSVCKVGYFPDSFGNMGQAPQILRQAGIDNAIFGRGVKATGFNNSTEDQSDDYRSPYSEMVWEAPDGSTVLGILFANWYHNGMEIPTEDEAAKAYWEARIPRAEAYASTPHLLFMNGCDHQPVQVDLPEALNKAKMLFPNIDFVHSSFDDYIKQVKASLTPDILTTIKGELRSQHTDGWTTLVNTASARMYIKQANQKGQAMLEKAAEPLAALAYQAAGHPYPHALLTYSWKTLMQNHPHDSICGCSTDEVHREMMTRFDKSFQTADSIVKNSMQAIAEQIDTSQLDSADASAVPFVVFNSTGWTRTGTVTLELDVARKFFDHGDSNDTWEEMNHIVLGRGKVQDHQGNLIPCEIVDLGVRFGYELPDDAFRRRYWSRRVRITIQASDVPALGYKTFLLLPFAEAGEPAELFSGQFRADDREMENEWIKVLVADNGSLTLVDKRNSRSYTDLCVYEDCGDLGDEYMFKQSSDKALTTSDLTAKIRLAEFTAVKAVIEIVHEWKIPASAEENHEKDVQRMVPFRNRTSRRSDQFVPLILTTKVTLERNARSVKVAVSFDNHAKDHRLRALLPTDLNAESHFADSIFEVAKRPNSPSPEWTNPSYCHHQQAFVDISSDDAGLTVANLGLPEYEVLQDGRNTIALTLLRAVGELGDWGVFPTPEAQCLGHQEVQFEIIPHTGDGIASGAYTAAYQSQIPLFAQQTEIHSGDLPPADGLLRWSAQTLALSAVRIAEETGDLILRWYNLSDKEDELEVKAAPDIVNIYESNVLEKRVKALSYSQHHPLMLRVPPYGIKTITMSSLSK